MATTKTSKTSKTTTKRAAALRARTLSAGAFKAHATRCRMALETTKGRKERAEIAARLKAIESRLAKLGV